MKNHGSLFSGIGGFDLAAQWMGWQNIFHCEWNEFGQKVLKHHFPQSISYGDITQTDFTIHRGQIDILSGGFPCQPYSAAGKRLGKEDDRHLWPEMLRATREIRPGWLVGENVRGLTNWSGGLVFDEVQSDLEAEGYEVLPFLLPACAVNAPHRRDRIWFVAYCNNARADKYSGVNRTWDAADPGGEQLQERAPIGNGQDKEKERAGMDNRTERQGDTWDATYTDRRRQSGKEYGKRESGWIAEKSLYPAWQNFPTQSPVCNGDDGLSSKPYDKTFYETNDMDRDYIIKNSIDSEQIEVNVDTGKIFSRRIRGHEGKLLELPGAECNGYRVHNISFNGIKKSCRAHQIVWIFANGLYDRDKYVIDHINRDKSDNRLSNLILATPSQNRRNSNDYTGQFTDSEKMEIATLYHNSDMSIRELAKDIGISKSRVQQIIQEQKILDGITFPKWRNESIKAGGNAIVPQVVYQIFKSIQEYDNQY